MRGHYGQSCVLKNKESTHLQPQNGKIVEKWADTSTRFAPSSHKVRTQSKHLSQCLKELNKLIVHDNVICLHPSFGPIFIFCYCGFLGRGLLYFAIRLNSIACRQYCPNVSACTLQPFNLLSQIIIKRAGLSPRNPSNENPIST